VLAIAAVLSLVALVVLGFGFLFVVCAGFAIIGVLVRALLWPTAQDKSIDGQYSVVEEERITPATSGKAAEPFRVRSRPG
jgi:hypothetical protein